MMKVLRPLVLAALLLVPYGCSAPNPKKPATASAADDVVGRPTARQIQQALACVEHRVGHRLPRPSDPAAAPEMTESETKAHFACVFELHLEKAFISPAGIRSLELAERIARRNRRERTCMGAKGWALEPATDDSSPVAIAERPAGAEAQRRLRRLRRDLAACGIPKQVIEDGFHQ